MGEVRLTLQDHSDADRINRGIAAGLGFAGTYPEEAGGELQALRRTFRVKAHTAFVERVCTIMVREHQTAAGDLGSLRVDDLPVVEYHKNLEMAQVPKPEITGRWTSSSGSAEPASAAPIRTGSGDPDPLRSARVT